MLFSLLTRPVLILAAVIPAIALLILVYRSDKLEKEPVGFLLFLLFLGIVSTFVASICESILVTIMAFFMPGQTEESASILYRIILYFVIVAGSEEGIKYFLLKKVTWKSAHFNCRFDGIVYAVFISLGFALWENIQYVFAYGIGAALIRALTAVPGHLSFAVFMGAFYGMAKKYSVMGNEKESSKNLGYSLAFPVVLHGMYDFIATLNSAWVDLIFIIFAIALFTVSFIILRKQAKSDEYIDNDNLWFYDNTK